MHQAAILTISDKASQGLRTDESGPVIAGILQAAGYEVVQRTILPDEQPLIVQELLRLVNLDIPLIITTGGTGCSLRDVTPEATKQVITRNLPGVAEAMRMKSLAITPRAMLSRGVCGLKDQSIILNLPGSPKACRENLSWVLESLGHGLDTLRGGSRECGANHE